jgi:hypothetical protein
MTMDDLSMAVLFCNDYHSYGYCKHEDSHYSNEEYGCFWDDWRIAIPVPDLEFGEFVLSENSNVPMKSNQGKWNQIKGNGIKSHTVTRN